MTHPPIQPRGEERIHYERLRKHELVYQHCASCEATVYPLRTVCPNCGEQGGLEVRASRGAGTVHSYTVQHRAGHPSLADRVPYALVLVDLDEGFRAFADVRDDDPTEVAIGQRVEAHFDDVDADTTFLRFRRAEETA